MNRKVIKQGNNTLTITLPARWAEEHDVKAGDSVFIEPVDNTVVVSTKPGMKKEKIEFDISEFDVALEKVIYSMYKRGYDEMEVRSTNTKLINRLHRIILETAIGFEVVHQTKTMARIKFIVENNRDEFEPIFRRIFHLMHSMEEGILHCIREQDVHSLITFRQMEATNNRYTGYCRRMMNKGLSGEKSIRNLLYSEVELLETIADEYKYLCCSFLDDRDAIKKVSNDAVKILEQICQFSRAVERLHYKYQTQDYTSLYRKRKRLVASCLNQMKNAGYPDSLVFHYLLNIVQRYTEIANLIMTMRL